MFYKTYQILTEILSPIIDLYLFYRLYKGKEEKKRFKERFGVSSINRPEGEIIWFQCASVGESSSVIPLIDRLIEKYNNNITILITSGTVTSAKMLVKKLENKKNIIYQYTPIDKYTCIKKFLEFWKPKALITFESEIWPNMIVMAHEYCEKVMIVNAKISEKSLKRWKIFKQFKEEIFDSIDICYPQNEENQLRLIELGVQNTNYIGNLKFSVSKLEINKKYLNELKESIGKRPFVLCASNHLEETELIYQLYEKLKKKFNDLIFILACRHPNKADEINNYLVKNFQITKRKTKNEIIDDKTNFYLYDEMGEMGTLYELSDIVLVCGSLVDGIGGHTPVEPAKHNCAIITAPFIKNNESLFEELKKVEGCIVVENEKNFIAELEEKIEKLLNFPNDVKKLQINAENICNKFSHVVEETAKSIINNLK